jgi:UDP-N-acetylmuramoyl-tripeptide--D-alanyl-D-alanine ligase
MAIASKKAKFTLSPKYADRIIHVNDPLSAVQQAAKKYRTELGILMIGITGSSGKTTTRSFISAVLRQRFHVGETYTNWNNHIGVPLSILKFDGDEWLGVIEMGANHCGEISSLSKITQPDIAVITNIGYAHVGLFGSLVQTTKAKFEIADGLDRKNGFLLLNGDDARLVAQARTTGLKTVFFGKAKNSSVVPQQVKVDPLHGCSFTVDGTEFVVKMPGRHFIYSALPAIYLGRRCGIPDNLIAAALASIEPVAMRGTLERHGDVEFVVDCYNANPSSMESALVYLDDVSGGKRKVAILGDMLELGRYTKRQHRELGVKAARSGIRQLIAVGPNAALIAEGARSAGMALRTVHECATAEAAVPVVKTTIRHNDTVLLKGSRGMHLETIYQQLEVS